MTSTYATTNSATITVTAKTWDEQRIVEADAQHAIARAVFTTELAGDLHGSSTATLLISYLAGEADDPSSLEGPYVGYEQVTGTGELTGIAGSGSYAAYAMTYTLTLDSTLEG